MISSEPDIKVGIIEHVKEIRGVLLEKFKIAADVIVTGEFVAKVVGSDIVLYGGKDIELIRSSEITFTPLNGGKFILRDVVFGINFHWERKEDETFDGALKLVARADGTITAINQISVEKYLASVISSEMSATAPAELLKAHAMTSRSWLVAMLEMKKRFSTVGVPSQRSFQTDDEITRWYDREDHDIFDVCADDHCQRYQGITKIISVEAQKAIEETRGVFLVYDNEICDARFYKACGGLTEQFENAWANTPIPYLRTVSCSSADHQHISSEEEASKWILSSPKAFCNTTDGNILRQVLPSFDQETTDFFRWEVEYSAREISELILKKSGIDFGEVLELIPIHRGPSGRINKLKIVGSKKTLIVGKELEIRRWFSKSHLYSSAFVVTKENDTFILHGAGWGHGVGLCQIGAAVMAVEGWKAEDIVKHYFRNAQLQKIY
ncbi:MAG: SpoIID/LytB domain-containing protein [Ignavibacteriales bacterium]|nr:SpoIID/LytB domain-containing protein [Ignavibacteriales bacterium]